MVTNTLQTPSQVGVLAVRGARGVVGRFLPGTAGSGAAYAATGLPEAARLRPAAADVPMTGLPIGAERAPSTTSTTPGDLSLGGPPS